MMVDIKDYRKYSPEELREYALKGLLCCGSNDLTDFVEYIFQGVIFEEDIQKELKEAYEDGKSDGYNEGWDDAVDNSY